MATRSRGMGAASVTALRRPAAGGAAVDQSLVTALATENPGQGFQMVRVSEVAEHPDNPRGPLRDLEELAASIRSLGLRQPIVVVPVAAFRDANPDLRVPADTRWVVLAGHRRRAAALQAGVAEVPAWVRADLATRTDAAETFIVENVHRAALAPLEEARVYSLLADLGSTQRQIASRSGVSQAHVSKRLALLKLPQAIQDAVATETLTVGDALALAALPEDRQLRTFHRAQQHRCPVPTAIQQLEREDAVQREAHASRERAVGESLVLLASSEQTGHRVVGDSAEAEQLRSEGRLFAGIDAAGRFRYLTSAAQGGVDPDPDPDSASEAGALVDSRLAALPIILMSASGDQLVTALVDAALALGAANDTATIHVQRSLSDSIGIRKSDPLNWLDAVGSADDSTQLKAALALSVTAALQAPSAVGDAGTVAYRRLMEQLDGAAQTTNKPQPAAVATRGPRKSLR